MGTSSHCAQAALHTSARGGQLSALPRQLNDKDAFLVFPVPKDKEPDEVAISNKKNNIQNATKVGLGTVIGLAAYEAVKWGIAAMAAPETFGGSLVGAAAIP